AHQRSSEDRSLASKLLPRLVRCVYVCCRHYRHGVSRALVGITWLQDLTKRWSQPLADAMTKFEFMRPLSMFSALAPASGGSAPSRWASWSCCSRVKGLTVGSA